MCRGPRLCGVQLFAYTVHILELVPILIYFLSQHSYRLCHFKPLILRFYKLSSISQSNMHYFSNDCPYALVERTTLIRFMNVRKPESNCLIKGAMGVVVKAAPDQSFQIKHISDQNLVTCKCFA